MRLFERQYGKVAVLGVIAISATWMAVSSYIDSNALKGQVGSGNGLGHFTDEMKLNCWGDDNGTFASQGIDPVGRPCFEGATCMMGTCTQSPWGVECNIENGSMVSCPGGMECSAHGGCFEFPECYSCMTGNGSNHGGCQPTRVDIRFDIINMWNDGSFIGSCADIPPMTVFEEKYFESEGECKQDIQCARCGDGVVQDIPPPPGGGIAEPGYKEECDDGNTESNDGCSSSCRHENCGDGIKQESEQCDDGEKCRGGTQHDGPCDHACVMGGGKCNVPAAIANKDFDDVSADDVMFLTMSSCIEGCTIAACSDGDDNDGDGLTDCQDNACGTGKLGGDPPCLKGYNSEDCPYCEANEEEPGGSTIAEAGDGLDVLFANLVVEPPNATYLAVGVGGICEPYKVNGPHCDKGSWCNGSCIADDGDTPPVCLDWEGVCQACSDGSTWCNTCDDASDCKEGYRCAYAGHFNEDGFDKIRKRCKRLMDCGEPCGSKHDCKNMASCPSTIGILGSGHCCGGRSGFTNTGKTEQCPPTPPQGDGGAGGSGGGMIGGIIGGGPGGGPGGDSGGDSGDDGGDSGGSSEPASSTPTSSTPTSTPTSSTPTSTPTSSTPTSSEPGSSEPTSSEPGSSTPTSSTPGSSAPTSSAPTSSEPGSSEPSSDSSSDPSSSTPTSSTPSSFTSSDPSSSGSTPSNSSSPPVDSSSERSSTSPQSSALSSFISRASGTHLECRGEACVEVPGGGEDECDRILGCGVDNHMICFLEQCAIVDGAGANECSDSIACNEFTKCVDQSCVVAVGEGENECASSKDCQFTSSAASNFNSSDDFQSQTSFASSQLSNTSSSKPPTVFVYCGDGVVQENLGEDCDAGQLNVPPGTPNAGCSCPPGPNCISPVAGITWKGCRWPKCGDGIINNELDLNGLPVNFDLVHEQCDDGNEVSGDGCSSECKIEGGASSRSTIIALQSSSRTSEGGQRQSSSTTSYSFIDILRFCGNSLLNPGEECDDGNRSDGDGCSATCGIEGDDQGCRTTADCRIGECIDGSCIPCIDDEECISGECNGGQCTGPNLVAAASVCGNGLLEISEECDDSNVRDNDGCNSTCLLEIGICGDGIVQSLLGEQCELSTHDPSLPYSCNNCRFLSSFCGNGSLDPGEECDNGPQNSTSPDAACRPDCSLSRCGDGIIDSTEICDDGNRLNDDGCDRYCRVEDGEPGVTVIAADKTVQFPDAPPQVQSQFQQQFQFPQRPTFQQLPYQLPLAQLQPLVQSQGPIGDTGPAAVAIIGAGAAAGFGWVRRRRK